MIESRRPLRIAVVGAGVSGLSAAWLLSSAHDVVVYEAAPRLGGHANTRVVDVAGRRIAVDAGFIVYNELTYPNFVALLDHLDVASKPTDMSFAVSIDDGALEYCGSGLAGLFAQRRNIVSPRFLVMLRDLVRFYRTAVAELPAHEHLSLDAFLDAGGYGRAFREDHLYPMAAAIWSTPAASVGAFPAATFISFCENHRLLSLGARPVWRTVEGGAFRYVDALAQPLGAGLRLATPVVAARRRPHGVELRDATGGVDVFDHVIFATHADQTLRILDDADAEERRLLGAVRYARNRAVLHSDPRLMPRRRAVWSSWNYLAARGAGAAPPAVTYWMNRLQGLPADAPLFVTLNPAVEPDDALVHAEETYDHPLFDAAAIAAQREAWSLQGVRGAWHCGAWMGAGFHEDGLQAGLAVAEALGGVRRPWRVGDESGRIFVGPAPLVRDREIAA